MTRAESDLLIDQLLDACVAYERAQTAEEVKKARAELYEFKALVTEHLMTSTWR